MKKIGKFLLFILTLIFVIILSIDIAFYLIRKESKKYLSEDAIIDEINNIDFIDILNQNKSSIKQIEDIKNELVDAGIPVETIDDFIESKPVKEATSYIVSNSMDYVLYGKTLEYNIDTETVYTFFEDNLPVISNELIEKNVPKSEYLTQENQEKILEKVKEKTPKIEEKVNELISKINNKLQNNPYSDKINKILSYIRLFYSSKLTFIILFIGVISIIFIFITRRSLIKPFKWIGISFILSSIYMYSLIYFLPIKLKQIIELPSFLDKILYSLLNNILTELSTYSLTSLIIGILLILLNITLYLIKREKKN
jgi:membrane-associated HD superfamily phosphohydrolase